MQWIIASDEALRTYFMGENIWSTRWSRVDGEKAHVVDGVNEWQMTVWRASFSAQIKLFAAEEVSNGNWIFAIPS